MGASRNEKALGMPPAAVSRGFGTQECSRWIVTDKQTAAGVAPAALPSPRFMRGLGWIS